MLRALAPWAAFLALAGALPFLPFVAGDEYRLLLANVMLVFLVLALSWDVLARTGQLSLAHAGFFGIGAYAVALAHKYAGLHPLAGAIAASLLGALVALVLGVTTLRLHGIYFAIATLAFVEVLRTVVLQVPDLTGGPVGISLPPLFGGDRQRSYLVGLALVALAVAASLAVRHSRLHYAVTALRTHEAVAALMGVDTVRVKVGLFVLSAALATVAGAFYMPLITHTDPYDAFNIGRSVEALVFPIFGGLYSTAGPVLGTLVLRLVEEYLRVTPPWKAGYQVIFGVILIVAVLFLPRGLLGLTADLRSRRGAAQGRPSRGGAASVDPDRAAAGRAGPAAFEAQVGEKPGGAPSVLERSQTPILRVEHLSRRFRGLVAVDDFSFDVPCGQRVAIIGPNGAGKTTVFNLISGLFPPDRGEILFDGVRLNDLSAHERCRLGIGRTFQIMQPFGDLSVVENVMVGLLFGSARSPALSIARREAERLCALVGLADALDAPALALTAPDRKRLEIARALATRPRLLLLDEVMEGLTPAEERATVEVLRRVNAAGVTLLLIEHVMSTVKALSDWVIVLDHGRKIAEGPYERVSADPQVIAAYLGAPDDAGLSPPPAEGTGLAGEHVRSADGVKR